ncbi:MAG TPA: hypothetical protein VLK82_08390 [Candidatus Tectomicrobia bacterium]|nr:hypothetical protein [Candidatus Tectomicrobia bacterium]
MPAWNHVGTFEQLLLHCCSQALTGCREPYRAKPILYNQYKRLLLFEGAPQATVYGALVDYTEPCPIEVVPADNSTLQRHDIIKRGS